MSFPRHFATCRILLSSNKNHETNFTSLRSRRKSANPNPTSSSNRTETAPITAENTRSKSNSYNFSNWFGRPEFLLVAAAFGCGTYYISHLEKVPISGRSRFVSWLHGTLILPSNHSICCCSSLVFTTLDL